MAGAASGLQTRWESVQPAPVGSIPTRLRHSAPFAPGSGAKGTSAGGKNAGLSTCWCNFEDMALPEGAPQPTYTIRGFEELLHIVMEQEELNNVGSPEKRHQLPVG